jgi:hypothetical protein
MLGIRDHRVTILNCISYYKKWLKSFMILMLASYTFAQNPGWNAPNATQFSFSANVVAKILINGVASNHPNDLVAFFKVNEVRGLGTNVSLGPNKLHFARIYSNGGKEVFTTKVYSGANNQTYESLVTITFRPYGVFGTLDNPLIIRIYTDNDAPVVINPLPPVILYQGSTFGPIDLAKYLISYDNNPVVWSILPNPVVDHSIDEDDLYLTPLAGSGIYTITLKVTEQTVNMKSATRQVFIYILNALNPPILQTIPGQGIGAGGQFFSFSLYDYESNYNGNCLAFDYYPDVLPLGVPSTVPTWNPVDQLQNNMTIISQIKFTDRYFYDHPADKAAIIIDNEVRALGFKEILNGKILYYFTVRGGIQTKTMTLLFYSGAHQRLMTYHLPLTYNSYQKLGTSESPYPFDFAPLKPVLSSNGLVNIVIQDPSWRGEQTFNFIARDCQNPGGGKDTSSAVFCVVNNVSSLPYYYKDNDGDGYGDPAQIYQVCDAPGPGFVNNNLDCDDENPNSIQIGITFEFKDSSGIYNDGHVCAGDSVIITSKSKSFQYIWSNLSTSFQLFLAPTSSATYTITVTGNYGCTGSASVSVTTEGTIVTNTLNDGPGTLRSVYGCINQFGTITYDLPSVNYSLLTQPFLIDKSVTIAGLNINNRPEIRFDMESISHGFNLSSGKTLTLQNTDLKLLNQTQKPAFMGLGSVSVVDMVKFSTD